MNIRTGTDGKNPRGDDTMACTALVGINWGDEGKGRMVDLLLAEWRANQK